MKKKVLLHGWIAKLSGIFAIGLTYIISKRYGSSHTLLYHRCNASGLGVAFIGDGSVTKALKNKEQNYSDVQNVAIQFLISISKTDNVHVAKHINK